MAQDSILGAPLNLVGLSQKERLSVEIAYTIGLNLAYFDMNDIHLETEMEINTAFARAKDSAIDVTALPENFNFLDVGPITPDTNLCYLLKGGTLEGMYLARKEGSALYYLGRDLTTFFRRS